MGAKFWRKCGKLITENGVPIRCKSSPCGFYSVIGIKYRELDCETLQPQNQCTGWQYTVNPYHVVNSAITWNDECITVQQKSGEMASQIVKKGCYTECIQTDPLTGECIQEVQHCTNCYEVKVYNLSGCTDDYNVFREEFFASCGGQYILLPQVWQNDVLTSEAQDCLASYWQGYFERKYMLNYTVRWQIRGECWWQYAFWMQYTYNTYYYSYCTDRNGNWCQGVYDGEGTLIGCVDQNCSIQEFEEKIPDRLIGAGVYGYMMDYDNNDAEINTLYVRRTGEPPSQGYYDLKCSDEANCYAGMSPINSHIMSFAEDKESYGIYTNGYYGSRGTGQSTHTCTNDNNLCTVFQYTSAPFENYYGDLTNAVTIFRWGRMKLQRTSYTPIEAIGIRFTLELTHINQNTGTGHQSSSSSVSSSSFSLNFGDDWYQDLPLALDVTLWTLLKNIVCNGNNCDSSVTDGCKFYMQPATNNFAGEYTGWNQDVKSETYKIKLIAREYIYNEQ